MLLWDRGLNVARVGSILEHIVTVKEIGNLPLHWSNIRASYTIMAGVSGETPDSSRKKDLSARSSRNLGVRV